MENLKVAYKKLILKHYRRYLSPLQERLNILDGTEENLYNFIEDSYNSIEDDNIALGKTFTKLENSTSFSFQEKMYGAMMLLLCDLKCQSVREKTEERNFRNKFDDEDDEDIDDEEED